MKITGLLREGDVVAVRAKVKFNQGQDEADVHIIVGGYSRCAVPLTDVLSLESREWEFGDCVQDAREHRGKVVGICEGMVWVKLWSGAFASYAALDLEPDPRPNPEAREEADAVLAAQTGRQPFEAARERLAEDARATAGAYGQGNPAEIEGA